MDGTMESRIRRGIRIIAVLVAVAAIGTVAYKASGFQAAFNKNKDCCMMTTARNISLSFRETLGITSYRTHHGQDKWVAETMFPGLANGSFIDVGSADGYSDSNAQALEARGWKGICVDPFPTNMEGRTCQMLKDAVWNESGKTVVFHTAGILGGIADSLGYWKDKAMEAPAVTLTTTTLDEILMRARALTFIHFMSLDVEGAEFNALRGLSLDRYRFGAMAIEHNHEEPKRTQIRELLKQYGYVNVHSYANDDFYAPAAAD
jgi:FkbM family methyltransferase